MKEDTLNYEIWKAVLHEVKEDEYAYRLTDQILKLFEKRIDSKLVTLKKLNPTEKEIIFTQGYNSAIYDIGEMLK